MSRAWARAVSRAWAGRMPTAYLNDRQVQATDFHKWRHARGRFERDTEDRKIVDYWKQQIQQRKPIDPLHLGISDRDHGVYIRDGHHRAIAHIELRAKDFPFVWSWIQDYGGTLPLNEPFPYDKANLNPTDSRSCT